jgi:hypothetical protein
VRLTSLLAPLAAALLSSGCLVLALQPAYDADSVVFDQRLLGSWENADDGSRATVERGEWRSYKITFTDRFATRSFQGNLTRIGPANWLDLTEMRGVDPGPFLVPLHGVMRIAIEGDRLTVAPLDYAWFTRALQQKSAARLALALDDRRNVVVTVPTDQIRSWLARAPEAAFSAPMMFTRSTLNSQVSTLKTQLSTHNDCRPFNSSAFTSRISGLRILPAGC